MFQRYDKNPFEQFYLGFKYTFFFHNSYLKFTKLSFIILPFTEKVYNFYGISTQLKIKYIGIIISSSNLYTTSTVSVYHTLQYLINYLLRLWRSISLYTTDYFAHHFVEGSYTIDPYVPPIISGLFSVQVFLIYEELGIFSTGHLQGSLWWHRIKDFINLCGWYGISESVSLLVVVYG